MCRHVAELQAHPLIGQMTKDIQETRAQKEYQRIADEGERHRLRAEAGQLAQDVVRTEVAKYEELRALIHAQVGRVWVAEQAYSRVTGAPSGVFAHQTFMQISLSTLNPKAQWAAPFALTGVLDDALDRT
jgi:hypothetical protein